MVFGKKKFFQKKDFRRRERLKIKKELLKIKNTIDKVNLKKGWLKVSLENCQKEE